MTESFLDRIKRALRGEEKLHPVEGELAKRWIKQRLLVVFPELRENPDALERAYRALDLEPRAGRGGGEPETVFEARFAGRLER